MPTWCAFTSLGAFVLVACASASPRVGYAPSGMAGNAVFFVESRADQDREYIVLCHSQRTPPCVRVAPGTIRDQADLGRWVESQEAYQRRQRPEPRPTVSRRDGSSRSPVPLVAGEDWADSSALVDAPGPPSEAPPETSSAGVGIVNIVTPGGWANIYDGEGHFLGQTPIQLRLRAGTQELSLRPFGQPPGDPDPIRVSVRPGESVSIVRRLEETPDAVSSQP